jgi:glycosyltransferase involved in cell wall biosynthesis
VYFAGNQPHEKTMEVYRGCLFFVLSSRAEGLPLVIVEAMANRKAVVATKVDGVPEIVQDGSTGLLVEPEDPESLAAALITLYKDRELRDKFAQRGRERALKKFTWEVIAAQYLSIFGAVSGIHSDHISKTELKRTA